MLSYCGLPNTCLPVLHRHWQNHPKNIPFILVTLEVSQFDISGNDFNELHPSNIPLISVTFEVFQFDISGIEIREKHPINIFSILKILFLFKSGISILFSKPLLLLKNSVALLLLCIDDKNVDSFNSSFKSPIRPEIFSSVNPELFDFISSFEDELSSEKISFESLTFC